MYDVIRNMNRRLSQYHEPRIELVGRTEWGTNSGLVFVGHLAVPLHTLLLWFLCVVYIHGGDIHCVDRYR